VIFKEALGVALKAHKAHSHLRLSTVAGHPREQVNRAAPSSPPPPSIVKSRESESSGAMPRSLRQRNCVQYASKQPVEGDVVKWVCGGRAAARSCGESDLDPGGGVVVAARPHGRGHVRVTPPGPPPVTVTHHHSPRAKTNKAGAGAAGQSTPRDPSVSPLGTPRRSRARDPRRRPMTVAMFEWYRLVVVVVVVFNTSKLTHKKLTPWMFGWRC
jgi:hypothetical protein